MRMDPLMLLPVEELHLSPIHGHQAVVIQRKQNKSYSQEHTVTEATDGNACTPHFRCKCCEYSWPTATASLSNDVSCNGGNNGSATVNLLNGTAPFNYMVSSGGNGTTASNLAAGTYTNVTDANGCFQRSGYNFRSLQFLLGQRTAAALCNGNTDGSASVVAGGGTAPYSYNWTPSGGSGPMHQIWVPEPILLKLQTEILATQTATAIVNQPSQLTGNLTPFTRIMQW